MTPDLVREGTPPRAKTIAAITQGPISAPGGAIALRALGPRGSSPGPASHAKPVNRAQQASA